MAEGSQGEGREWSSLVADISGLEACLSYVKLCVPPQPLHQPLICYGAPVFASAKPFVCSSDPQKELRDEERERIRAHLRQANPGMYADELDNLLQEVFAALCSLILGRGRATFVWSGHRGEGGDYKNSPVVGSYE